MKSFSCIATVLALVIWAKSTEARAMLQSQKQASTTTNVECVIQAFGSDLEDKGIAVEVRHPGFNCNTFLRTTITGFASFIGGEAEVALTLPADNFHICASAIVIEITLPYDTCDSIPRVISGASWGLAAESFGDCRALEQQCESTISAAAIPYIDMWCRRPAGRGGQPEGMRLRWSSQQGNDRC